MIKIYEWAKDHVKRHPGGLADRISKHTEWQGDCLLWVGSRNNKGYPKLSIYIAGARKKIYAHRLMWVLANRMEIPEGLTIDHTCVTNNCIAPKHLEAVTGQENTVRRDSRRTK